MSHQVRHHGFWCPLRNQFTGVGQIFAVGDCAGGNLATLGQAQAVRAVRNLGSPG